jgi:hypothetical protein
MNKNVDNQMPTRLTATSATAEDQLAYSIADLLDGHAQQLSADVEDGLSKARNLALNQLTERQAQVLDHQGVNQSGNVLQWFGGPIGQYFGHHRFTSLTLIIVAMLFIFFTVQHLGLNNNLEHSDAFLLASDLPPEAYADKGFDTWLETEN